MKIMILISILLMPYHLLAEEVSKLETNAKAITCEELSPSVMANLKQNELENIYCGYEANIGLIETFQAKQFEAYPKDIKIKSSIQKTNIEKIMKCMEYKAKVDESLKKIDAAYVLNCDKYKKTAGLKKP